jgi:xanthine/uracil permease
VIYNQLEVPILSERVTLRTWGVSFFLIISGIFAKFAAALVAIPSAVLGGMTSFLFCAVAVSGIAIITRGVPFNRRNRFVLTAGLALGYGSTLVPTYFNNVFTYSGDNKSLQGFLDAIVLIMETGFAVTAVVCMILNLILPEEIEETDERFVPDDQPEPEIGVPRRHHKDDMAGKDGVPKTAEADGRQYSALSGV